MLKPINHTCWKRSFALLIALVFLIFGTSIHIPIAEALAHQPAESAHKNCDFTIEIEETLEENEEEANTGHTLVKTLGSKGYMGFIHRIQIMHFGSWLFEKTRSLTPFSHLIMEVLFITGRIHSVLPG